MTSVVPLEHFDGLIIQFDDMIRAGKLSDGTLEKEFRTARNATGRLRRGSC